MFLSRVEVNPYRRETMVALKSPQVMHAAIMASFPSFEQLSEGRILWRVDKVGSATYILIQSSMKPDMTHLVDQYGRPNAGQKGETLDYEPFLLSISKGEVFRFRLSANPTYSGPAPKDGGRGKVYPHVTVKQQLQWLVGKSEGCGFSIVDDDGNVKADIVHREMRRFKRGDGWVSISYVVFEGVLRVSDPDTFRTSLISGIGRAKSYGCGMMTLMR